MSTWVDSLKDERDSLSEKLAKLESFLAEISRDDQKRSRFDGWQVELMKMQYGHMLAYWQILDLRLKEVENAAS